MTFQVASSVAVGSSFSSELLRPDFGALLASRKLSSSRDDSFESLLKRVNTFSGQFERDLLGITKSRSFDGAIAQISMLDQAIMDRLLRSGSTIAGERMTFFDFILNQGRNLSEAIETYRQILDRGDGRSAAAANLKTQIERYVGQYNSLVGALGDVAQVYNIVPVDVSALQVSSTPPAAKSSPARVVF